MVGIGEPVNRSSVALAASADGSVIVGQAAGFASIWTSNNGMIPLHDVLASYGLSDELDGWLLIEATGISDDGTVIVGYGFSPNSGIESYEAWVAIVPEPNGLILGGIGLAIFALWHCGRTLSTRLYSRSSK
jgi:hypothetical protein